MPPSEFWRARQKALAEFALHALRSNDYSALLQQACAQVANGLNVPIAKIAARQDGMGNLILRAAVGLPEHIAVPNATVIPAGKGSALGYAMEVARPVVSDVETETRFEPSDIVTRAGIKTTANVVIWVNGEPYGGLEADSTKAWQPSEADIDFLQTYSTVVSAAIERHLLMQRAEDLARERRILLNELFHRIRNLLTVVLSVFRRTRRHARTIQELQESFEERIGALSRAHDLLLAAPAEPVSLRELLALEAKAKGLTEGARFSYEGPDIQCGPRAIQGLALAIAELGTNAMKYGALAREAPAPAHLRVDWRVDAAPGGGRVVFTWRERGLASRPQIVRRGFGSELLERLVPQMLSGTARYTVHDDGIEWEDRFPLEQWSRELPQALDADLF